MVALESNPAGGHNSLGGRRWPPDTGGKERAIRTGTEVDWWLLGAGGGREGARDNSKRMGFFLR